MSTFELVYSQLLEEAAGADWNNFGAGWVPEKPYRGRVVLESVKEKEDKSNEGVDRFGLSLCFILLDGEYADRKFYQNFRFLAAAAKGNVPNLQGLCRIASALSGEDIRELAAARAIVNKAADQNVELNVNIVPNEKSPKYPRMYINSRVGDPIKP